jgi:hypothetical protein
MTPSPRPASSREARRALEYAIGTVPRANPVVFAWRWRYELAATAMLIATWIALNHAAAAALTGGLAAVLALTACFRRGRRFLAGRAWCIATAHRVRAGCTQAWIHTRYGKLPFILWTPGTTPAHPADHRRSRARGNRPTRTSGSASRPAKSRAGYGYDPR